MNILMKINTHVISQLIFQSQFEEGATYGTIALDDVEVLYTACPENSESVTVQMSEAPTPLSAPSTTTEAVPTTESARESTTDGDFTTPDDFDSGIEEQSFDVNSIDEHTSSDPDSVFEQ